MTMNKDTLAGSWNEMKGKAIKKWAKLTDNDFTGFKGNIQELKGKVQHLYGYSKEQVEKEFSDFSQKGAEIGNAGLNKLNAAIDSKKQDS